MKLLSTLNGVKLYGDRSMSDVTRSGRKVIRSPGYVVVGRDGHETYFGKDLNGASYWQEVWSKHHTDYPPGRRSVARVARDC
jgi:hypothetical protein